MDCRGDEANLKKTVVRYFRTVAYDEKMRFFIQAQYFATDRLD